MSEEHPSPDVLLFITPGCPHCAGVLATLTELVKQGAVGSLEVVNAAERPQRAAALGVRSVPWTCIGTYILEGAQTPGALRDWTARAATGEGGTVYLQEMLAGGRLDDAETFIAEDPGRLQLLLPLLRDFELPMQVRVGTGALIEAWAGSDALQVLVPVLARLSEHPDQRLRADACHYLGLSRSEAARPALRVRLADDDADVREIAADALEELDAAGAGGTP